MYAVNYIYSKMRHSKKEIYLGMELIEGGNLKQLIKDWREKGEEFSYSESRNIMKGILNGTNHLHENNIVHRDIKPGKQQLGVTFRLQLT